jgi:hypothetical protein
LNVSSNQSGPERKNHGLVRFDGVYFEVFDENNTPAMRISRATSLFETADVTPWIGD